MSDVRVTFARPYTDWSGKDHKTDSTASLDLGEADHVLRLGYARPADKPVSTGKEG